MNKNNQESNNSCRNNNFEKKEKVNFLWIIAIAAMFFYLGSAWKVSEISMDDGNKAQEFIKNISDPKSVLSGMKKGQPKKVDFGVFWEAWEEMSKNYVDEDALDPQKMVYGAINGMIGAVGDPYSGFMNPEDARDFDSEMEGSFEGIGAELGMKDEVLTIISPIDDMPAQKAGLRAGDKILKIDGEITADISIDEAVKKIRGTKGTDVTLTIFRMNDEIETKDITITRNTIELKSVIYEKKENGIGYIRINKFVEDTSREFNKEITKAIADDTKGLIVDVRNNPGGYLNISIEIASKFVPKGDVVVWEEDRDKSKKSFKAMGGAILSEVPTVVLINKGSASASEILAGALRDNNGSKLIGTQSFGKGSVQRLETLEDNSSLRITIAKWLTPSEKSIHGTGLTPDIEVKFSEEDYENENDVQLQRAIEELENEINQ